MAEKKKIHIPMQLPIGRCGFPKLDPANPPLQGLEPNERKRWSIELYLNPEQDKVKALKKALEQAASDFEDIHGYEPAQCPKLKKITEWANKTKTRRTDKSLLGMVQLSLGANAEKKDGGMHIPPAVVDVDKEPIPHRDIYPGCRVRCVALLQEYSIMDKKGNVIGHGLSFLLKTVQFIGDGERMGGDTTDYSKFLDDELDDDEYDIQADSRSGVSDDDI